MSGTSKQENLKGLSERLQRRRREAERESGQRLAAERRRWQELTESELRKLGASARGAAQRELSTIEGDLRAGRGRVNALALKAWARAAGIGAAIFLGVLVGSWGLTSWQAGRILRQQEALAAQQVAIAEQERTLEILREKTWGVVLHEGSDGRYVVLPKGSERDTRWTIGGRPSVKFSSK